MAELEAAGTASKLSGTGIWAFQLRYADPPAIPEIAAALEELGYSALWLPDVGGDVFGAVELLLRATQSVTVATGILNLWMHTAEQTAAEHARLSATYPHRFLAGIGVSHAPVVDAQAPGRYRKPLAAMTAYLDDLDRAARPLVRSDRVLAALGPKMLELARDRAAGAHPYNVTPEHSAMARRVLGPDAALLPEQAVAWTTDRETARRLGRSHLAVYLTLPNYLNNLRRLGFADDDFADGGSDRLVDGLVAWGQPEAIRARVQEHRDAGADHVCIQVLTESKIPMDEWRELAPVLQ